MSCIANAFKQSERHLKILLVGLFASLLVYACDDSSTITGVVGTGNTARISGVVQDSTHAAVPAKVNLVRIDSQGTPTVASLLVGSDGKFEFGSLPQGLYRVVVDKESMQGAVIDSISLAASQKKDLGAIVINVYVTYNIQITNVTINNYTVQNFYIGSPGNPVQQTNGSVTLQAIAGDGQPIYVQVADPAGGSKILEYRLVLVDGEPVFLPVGNSPDLDVETPPDPVVFDPFFAIQSSTVALWSFDALASGRVLDRTANGLALSSVGVPALVTGETGKAYNGGSGSAYFSLAGRSPLSLSSTGKLVYEARIYLDAYPPASTHNNLTCVVGYYEGLKLLIGSDGRIQAVTQRGEGSSWGWFAPISLPGVVPLKRWVTVAVAADQTTRDAYAWVDGVPVPLYMAGMVSGTQQRAVTGTFTVGQDPKDGQKFTGLIDEIRVSNELILGPGRPSEFDPYILSRTEAPVSPELDTLALEVLRDVGIDREDWNSGKDAFVRLYYDDAVDLLDFGAIDSIVAGRDVVSARLIVNGWIYPGVASSALVANVAPRDWIEGAGNWYWWNGTAHNGYATAFANYPNFIPPQGTEDPAFASGIRWSTSSALRDALHPVASANAVLPAPAAGSFPLPKDIAPVAFDVTTAVQAMSEGGARSFAITQGGAKIGAKTPAIFFYSRENPAGAQYAPHLVLILAH